MADTVRKGLYLTREGRWLHDGDGVDHPRLCALLHRSIALAPDGTLVVTTGKDVMPFACEDTPLRITSVQETGGWLQLALTNETVQPLPDAPVWMDADGSLRCQVGGLWARFSREAQLQLDAWLEEADGHFWLRTGHARWQVEKASR